MESDENVATEVRKQPIKSNRNAVTIKHEISTTNT